MRETNLSELNVILVYFFLHHFLEDLQRQPVSLVERHVLSS
jgi:hypothetical protein